MARAARHQQKVLAAAATVAVQEHDRPAVVEVDVQLAGLGAVRELLAELAGREGRGGLVAPAASLRAAVLATYHHCHCEKEKG